MSKQRLIDLSSFNQPQLMQVCNQLSIQHSWWALCRLPCCCCCCCCFSTYSVLVYDLLLSVFKVPMSLIPEHFQVLQDGLFFSKHLIFTLHILLRQFSVLNLFLYGEHVSFSFREKKVCFFLPALFFLFS